MCNKKEDEDICNDPHACTLCSRTSEWPSCMNNVELRGYHPIFQDSWDDVVSCDNQILYLEEVFDKL